MLKAKQTYQIVTTNAIYQRATVLTITKSELIIRYEKSILDRFDNLKTIGTKTDTIQRRFITSYREIN